MPQKKLKKNKKTPVKQIKQTEKQVKKVVSLPAQASKKTKSLPKKTKEYDLAKIKVIGVGGAGGNAVTRMSGSFPRGVELVVVNTDIQDLHQCEARKKIYIGKNITKGLGAGMNPELGRQAAEENSIEIADLLDGTDMVFLTAGFGGGTGSGALPVIAETAKSMGIITIAIVTKPFIFEGFERQRIAEESIMRLKDKVDTLIIIPNDRIFSVINKNTSIQKAFKEIDEVLKNAVVGITDLITVPGIINVDFADVKAIIQNAGSAVIGVGSSVGASRASGAVNSAINSPLLEISIEGAKRVLFSISGNRDLKMSEINEVAKSISEHIHTSSKVIFGAYHDRRLKKGELKVTLVAADFNGEIRKDIGLLPNLFVSEYNVKAKNENKAEEQKGDVKEHKKKKEEEKEKIEKDDVWDVPTFLRKKK